MKLVADINNIMTNLNSLAPQIEDYNSAVSAFNSANIDCNLEEISGVLDSYKSTISDDLSKLSTSSEEYKQLVDDCCSKYESNEENVKTINVDAIVEIIMKKADVTTDYKGSAKDKLTGLKSTEIKPPMSEDTVFVSKDGRVVASKSDTVNAAMAWAIRTADDNSVGYSQATRWGNPNYDCSSFVITAWQNAGIDVKGKGATYTGNMKNAFLATGKFEWIPGPVNANNLRPGDVVLNQGAHVEMYMGNGNNAGAHTNADGRD